MPRRKREGDPFWDVEQKLKGLEAAEKRHDRFVRRRCDWDDPTDVAYMKRMDRNDVRQALLDKLVPDRKCPLCKEMVLKSQSWVVNKTRRKAICRSCWNITVLNPKFVRGEGEDGIHGMGYIQLKRIFAITGERKRVAFNCVALSQAIQIAGHTKASFSRRAGWSGPYTSQLLNPERTRTVSADTARVILQVLAERDVQVELTTIDKKGLFPDDNLPLWLADRGDGTETA